MQSSLHLRASSTQRPSVCARVAKSQTRAASSDKPAERQSRATTAPREAEASETGTQKVYIGKGRFIDDDPEKYPDKNKLGVGGWAGGEAGLWRFRDDILREDGAPRKPPVTESNTMIIRKDKLDGNELVYVGKGVFVRDDPRKYANREKAGFLTTGGFFGGEKGVQQFVKDGKFDIADEKVFASRQRLRDAALLLGLVALLAGGSYGLVRLGLLEFSGFPGVAGSDLVGQAPAAPAEGVTEGVESAAEAVSEAVRKAPPLRVEFPQVSREAWYAVAITGVPLGTVLLVAAFRDKFTWSLAQLGRAVQRNTLRAAVLAAAAAIGNYLLTQ